MATIDGETEAKEKATMTLPVVGTKEGIVLEGAEESVIPASDITCKGSNLVYYQDEEGAVIYNKETKEANERR